MDCVRSRPPRGVPLHPIHGRSYLICHAMRWVWVFTPEQQERGVHAMIASPQRIPPESIDPTVKNFHWGDLTRGNFEAHDQGAETCILLDRDGNVTEGPGFNVFAVIDGRRCHPEARRTLEGITRRTVMELCAGFGIRCELRDIPRSEFERADEIFFSTTAGGIMPASRLGKIVLGNDRPGPISVQLRTAFWEKRRKRLARHTRAVRFLSFAVACVLVAVGAAARAARRAAVSATASRKDCSGQSCRNAHRCKTDRFSICAVRSRLSRAPARALAWRSRAALQSTAHALC